MDLLTGDMLQRYLLATAVTFGLLALLGWFASRFGPGYGVQLGHALGQRFKGNPASNTSAPRQSSGFLSGLFKNSPTGSSAQRLKKVDSLLLTPQHQLHKVQDGLRTYLFTTHPQGITLLSSTIESRGNYEADTPPINYAAPRPPQPAQPTSPPTSVAKDLEHPMILARSKPRRT